MSLNINIKKTHTINMSSNPKLINSILTIFLELSTRLLLFSPATNLCVWICCLKFGLKERSFRFRFEDSSCSCYSIKSDTCNMLYTILYTTAEFNSFHSKLNSTKYLECTTGFAIISI